MSAPVPKELARADVAEALRGLTPRDRKARAYMLLLASAEAIATAESGPATVAITVITRDTTLSLMSRTVMPTPEPSATP